jgi:Raf kinase inhibitor-like YbhB/YbcL family protein
MQVVSPVFKEGTAIPPQYSCKGQNISPPLNFVLVPQDAKSLALIVHDPDAPSGDYVHWTVWDIPADTGTIAANSLPVGAIQGVNSAGENKYMGPCPPSGTHRYMFELYALDASLGLPAETERDGLLKAMEGHILERFTLTGTFSAS